MSADAGGNRFPFKFVPIPMSIYKRADLLPIDKMLIGRILSFGKTACFLAQETMAEELGVHRQHINERMTFLTERGLVESKRGRYGKSYRVNEAKLDESRCPPEQTSQNPDVCQSRREMSATADVRCPPEQTQVDALVDKLVEGSSSEVVDAVPAEDDDSPLSLKTENQKPSESAVSACLWAAVKAWGIPNPKGKFPDQEIAALLEKMPGATVKDLAHFLRDDFREKRGGNPATWRYLLVAVQHWAADPKVLAHLEANRIFAEHVKADDEKRIQQEIAEREWQRIRHTPTNPEKAIELAAQDPHVQRRYRGVPKIVQKHLLRVGEEVSPDAVIAMCSAHHNCDRCDKSGLVGSVFARDRRFCFCLFATELEIEDPERPAREIEHAHSNLRNKLLAAAQTVSVYVADAIEASTITETPSEVIFEAPKSYRLFFADKDFPEVLKRAGEHRVVRLKWQAAA